MLKLWIKSIKVNFMEAFLGKSRMSFECVLWGAAFLIRQVADELRILAIANEPCATLVPDSSMWLKPSTNRADVRVGCTQNFPPLHGKRHHAGRRARMVLDGIELAMGRGSALCPESVAWAAWQYGMVAPSHVPGCSF